jgi:hypothetical protein
MSNTYYQTEIQRLKKQIEELKEHKKSQAAEIDLKINRLEGQIFNYQKTIDRRRT